jgi:hypothetical protein
LIFHKLFLLRFLATEKMKDEVSSGQTRLWNRHHCLNNALFNMNHLFFFPLRQKEPKSASAGRTWLKSTLYSGKMLKLAALKQSHFSLRTALIFTPQPPKHEKRKEFYGYQLTLVSKAFH